MEKSELKLPSGKKVVVKELSALEDVLSYRMLGSDFDEKNQFGSGVTVRSIQVALAVVSIDDVEVKPMRKLEDVFEFMARFSKRDWTAVMLEFAKLNEEGVEGE
jgi:hypothetical protein